MPDPRCGIPRARFSNYHPKLCAQTHYLSPLPTSSPSLPPTLLGAPSKIYVEQRVIVAAPTPSATTPSVTPASTTTATLPATTPPAEAATPPPAPGAPPAATSVSQPTPVATSPVPQPSSSPVAPAGATAANATAVPQPPVVTTLPLGHTVWGCYETPAQLDALIAWLDERGLRERPLKHTLRDWSALPPPPPPPHLHPLSSYTLWLREVHAPFRVVLDSLFGHSESLGRGEEITDHAFFLLCCSPAGKPSCMKWKKRRARERSKPMHHCYADGYLERGGGAGARAVPRPKRLRHLPHRP